MIETDQFASRLLTSELEVFECLQQALSIACAQRNDVPDEDHAGYHAAQRTIDRIIEQIAARPAPSSRILAIKAQVLTGLSNDVGGSVACDACDEMRRSSSPFQKLAWSIVADTVLALAGEGETGLHHG